MLWPKWENGNRSFPPLKKPGKFILSLWSEHEDFATKYQNDVADAPQVEEQSAELALSESVDSTFEPIVWS